jgi:hypothetical protein
MPMEKAADSTSESIVLAMNFLCKNADVDHANLLGPFEWNLIVEAAAEVAGNKVLQSVQLSMSRKWLEGGRGWSRVG